MNEFEALCRTNSQAAEQSEFIPREPRDLPLRARVMRTPARFATRPTVDFIVMGDEFFVCGFFAESDK